MEAGTDAAGSLQLAPNHIDHGFHQGLDASDWGLNSALTLDPPPLPADSI